MTDYFFRMILILSDLRLISRLLQAYIVKLASIAEILFDFCFSCGLNNTLKIMPGVPQGAFAACKVREREMKLSKMQQKSDQDQEKMFYHGKYLELSPLKYNSKLMNSIWGLYNRYSVHNFKKITDGHAVAADTGSQLGLPVSADKSAKNPSKSSPILVSDWTNIWGTHKH